MIKPFDLNQITTYPLKDRKSLVSIEDFAEAKNCNIEALLKNFPNMGMFKNLKQAAKAIIKARNNDKDVIFGFGGHVIKLGLGPIINDLIHKKFITGVITTGSGAIHELELALQGKTSEDVNEVLTKGEFGFAKETANLFNTTILCEENDSLGNFIGHQIYQTSAHTDYTSVSSILGATFMKNLFAGIIIAMGTDIIHMHPNFDPCKIGKMSYNDFLRFCEIVKGLNGGVYINAGSAVILPEVFLKAISMAYNVGANLDNLTTINIDMINHYRPLVNVVNRPGGKGINILGCHEIILPLLRLMIYYYNGN